MKRFPFFPALVYSLVALVAVTAGFSGAAALLCGMLLTVLLPNPFSKYTQPLTHWLLKAAVIGLGFGTPLHTALQAGKEGFAMAAVSILCTIGAGLWLGKRMQLDRPTATLIASGTAVCGGSAIAAMSPVIKANSQQTTVALGVVFLFNALALFVFPPIGRWLHLSQHQFGLWSAIAIHDTSAVTGAAAAYGKEALTIATTVKLARALWIVPLSLVAAFLTRSGAGNVKLPWFILGFVAAIACTSWFPQGAQAYTVIHSLAGRVLTLTLFFIGTSLHPTTLRQSGIRPFATGLMLWVGISAVSLTVIYYGMV